MRKREIVTASFLPLRKTYSIFGNESMQSREIHLREKALGTAECGELPLLGIIKILNMVRNKITHNT